MEEFIFLLCAFSTCTAALGRMLFTSTLKKLALSQLDRHSMGFDQLAQMRTYVLALELLCVHFGNALTLRDMKAQNVYLIKLKTKL
jgi:hypothetical protein